MQVAGQHYFVIRFEQLLACAQEIHDASKGPAVLSDVRVKDLSGLGGTPLFEAGPSFYLVLLAFKLHRDVEIYHFDAHALISEFIRENLFILI